MPEELNPNPVDIKLDSLWKEYADLFNDYNPLLEEHQREKMDYLLSEIRSLEGKRSKLNQEVHN